jgi:hypothetical protein
MHRSTIAAALGGIGIAAAVPALALAHTTISATQPQGPALTAARTAYVVRAPNETPSQRTFKLVMFVPESVRQAISVRHDPNWKVTFKKAKVGTSAEGAPAYAISRVTWTAKTRADEIAPFEYGEWPVRFQNPAVAGRMCFGFWQYYTNARTGKRAKPEVVRWTGAAGADTPASCLDVVDQPPAP